MLHFLNIDNINISIGGILLVLSVVMLMIPINPSSRWHNFRLGRNTLSIAYTLLGILMIVNGFIGAKNSELSGMITLIISFYQALLFTKICVLFLKPRSYNNMPFKTLMAGFTLYSIGIATAFALKPTFYTPLFYGGLLLYTLLLIYCSVIFIRNYNETLRHLEYVFDEDMHLRLRWVKGCFFSALLVGIMAWFMTVFYESETFNALCICVYTIYYICLVGYFMHYVSNYGFIVNSDNTDNAPKELPETPKSSKPIANKLNNWVKQKKFRDSDKTVDDIVEELNTTRAELNEYMNITYGTNFRSWRNSLRIEEAKRLLTDSEIPVAEIYLAVGYSDRSNFHRQFAETNGLTPLQYRQKFKNK